MGTGMCPGNYRHLKSARAHIDTGRVPGNIWAPKWSTGKYRHRNGAQTHMGAGWVPEQIFAPEWFSVTYEHRNGARAHFGTGRVTGHIWALKGCPGTCGHWEEMPGLTLTL